MRLTMTSGMCARFRSITGVEVSTSAPLSEPLVSPHQQLRLFWPCISMFWPWQPKCCYQSVGVIAPVLRWRFRTSIQTHKVATRSSYVDRSACAKTPLHLRGDGYSDLD